VEPEGSLVSDCGVMTVGGGPELNDHTRHKLQHKGSPDVEDIQRRIGPPCTLLWEILREGGVTQDGCRPDSRDNGPRDA
jgi:hypothetical protein